VYRSEWPNRFHKWEISEQTNKQTLGHRHHTQLYLPSNAATIKKTNKTKKKKRNKPLQDKSNTTRQHNSILGLIFSTQSTNDIIGYGELAQKIRFSITYAHQRQRKIKHFRAAGRNFFGSSIEHFHEFPQNLHIPSHSPAFVSWYLIFLCVSWTITGQPRNSVFIRRM